MPRLSSGSGVSRAGASLARWPDREPAARRARDFRRRPPAAAAVAPAGSRACRRSGCLHGRDTSSAARRPSRRRSRTGSTATSTPSRRRPGTTRPSLRAASSRSRRTAGQPPGKQVSRMAARCSAHGEGIHTRVGPDSHAVLLEPGVGRHDVEIRTRRGGRPDRRKSLRLIEVVGVKDRDEVSRRSSERMVERRSAATVSLAEHDDLVTEAVEDRLRRIGGSVVADDHLVRGRRLGERRLDCTSNGRRRVVTRNEDRDARRRPGGQPGWRLGSEQSVGGRGQVVRMPESRWWR